MPNTSSAPSSSRRSMTYPNTCGFRSSRFASSTEMVSEFDLCRAASAASPITSRTTFGLRSKSRDPAPYPALSIFICGNASKRRARVLTIAAPVGVTNSACTPEEYTGASLQQFQRRWSGNRESPMSTVHCSSADIQRRAYKFSRPPVPRLPPPRKRCRRWHRPPRLRESESLLRARHESLLPPPLAPRRSRSRRLLCRIRDRRNRDDLPNFVQPAMRVPVRVWLVCRGSALPGAGLCDCSCEWECSCS